MRRKQFVACRDGGGMGGEGGVTTVPGMHDLSQPLHSLCFSILGSGAAEGVCGMQGRGWQGRGQGGEGTVSGAGWIPLDQTC